jgi:hypothetical protein
VSLPVGDWQFWVVSVLALAAAAWVLRGVLPIPFLTARHRRKKRERRVNLTVGGKTVK